MFELIRKTDGSCFVYSTDVQIEYNPENQVDQL